MESLFHHRVNRQLRIQRISSRVDADLMDLSIRLISRVW